MSYTNDTKPSNSFSNDTKPTTSYSDGYGFLKKEDNFYLLLENGGKILLDQSFNSKRLTIYINDSK